VNVSRSPDSSCTVCFERRRSAEATLLCLPHAGAGASIFRGWGGFLPDSVELRGVQLPGREGRFREPLAGDLEALVDDLAEALEPWTARPYALFGHSMGALIAFELARRLEAAGARAPLHVFLAGYGAPHVYRSRTRLHLMPHDEVVADLRRAKVTPAAVLEDPGLMRALVPILQADLGLCARHDYRAADAIPLDTDISAFGGTEDDEVPPETVAAWADLTTGSFRLRMLPGGHFFPASARAALLEAIASDLAQHPVAA
jgi:medium-chain acyl-[acyl-carrier-protein] hydrolase